MMVGSGKAGGSWLQAFDISERGAMREQVLVDGFDRGWAQWVKKVVLIGRSFVRSSATTLECE